MEIKENFLRTVDVDSLAVGTDETGGVCIAGQNMLVREAEVIVAALQGLVDYEPFYSIVELFNRLKDNADRMLWLSDQFRREWGIGYHSHYYNLTPEFCGRRECQWCYRLKQPHRLVWKLEVLRRIEASDGSFNYRRYLKRFPVRKSRTVNGQREYYYEDVYSAGNLPHEFWTSRRKRETKDRFKQYNEAARALNRERKGLVELHKRISLGVQRRSINAVKRPVLEFEEAAGKDVVLRKRENRRRFFEKRGIEEGSL